jgi:predicted DNA-binding transcriptional regulator AlpA
MKNFSTRQAAKKLGLHTATLAQYIAVGKVPAPKILDVGTSKLHAWTDAEIEHVRQLLPKIANGRKTRYKKKQSAVSTHGKPGQAQQSAKTKPKTRKPKKK